MRISGISNNVYNSGSPFASKRTKNNQDKQVSFKSAPVLLTLCNALMQSIEKQGYILAFLIQDGLGMTMPRILTGFFRDRKETNKFNFKEAKEVALRESLTGPFLISAAPIMLFLTGRFCKSTNTNTRLLKIMGTNFKSMLKDSSFDKSIKNNSEKFQKELNRYNLKKFYTNTVPTDKNPDKTLEYIYKEFDTMTKTKSKERNQAIANITQKINDKILETSSDLDKVGTLSIDIDGKTKTFKTKEVLLAIRDFSDDAIKNNKKSNLIDENAIENIKNNLAAKRTLFTLSTIAATLGGLSVIPKIYAKEDIPPSAQHLIAVQQKEKNRINDLNNEKTQEDKLKNKENETNDTSFKGKGINSGGIFSSIGKFLTKSLPEWFNKEFEYDGINFTKSLMASLSLFGLLLPRGIRAYNRALVDDNGKKDLSEVNEILLRDTISSLGVVYIVPILTKLFVNSCENKHGFVLTNKAAKDKDKFHKSIDILNPYSSIRVFENSDLDAIYNNVDSKAKMLNLCDYIDKKDGDLSKILSKSKNSKLILDECIKSKASTVKEKNKQIISFIKNMDEKKAKEIITKVMKDTTDDKGSIAKFARELYSVPGAATTAVISPIILGCLIPLLTYSNTRKAHKKMTINLDNQPNSKTSISA